MLTRRTRLAHPVRKLTQDQLTLTCADPPGPAGQSRASAADFEGNRPSRESLKTKIMKIRKLQNWGVFKLVYLRRVGKAWASGFLVRLSSQGRRFQSEHRPQRSCKYPDFPNGGVVENALRKILEKIMP